MLSREGCANEAHAYTILVSLREDVCDDRLSVETGTPTASAGITPTRDGNGQGRRMGEVPLGNQGHAVLADIDAANPLIKVYPARIGTLNPHSHTLAHSSIRALLCKLLAVFGISVCPGVSYHLALLSRQHNNLKSVIAMAFHQQGELIEIRWLSDLRNGREESAL